MWASGADDRNNSGREKKNVRVSTTRERKSGSSRASYLMEGLRMLLLKVFLLLLLLPGGASVAPAELCCPLPLAPCAASAAETREDFWRARAR